MIKKLLLFCYIILLTACHTDDAAQQDPSDLAPFYKGMDLSFLPENEQLGVVFKDENDRNITDNYDYLASRGVNLIRIRLWVSSSNASYSLENLKAQVLQVKAAGMDYLLDFHYSDTWADPGSQEIPFIWLHQTDQELLTTVSDYTTQVLLELKNQGTEPAIVQIGNETNNGLLWPIGQIYNGSVENFDTYIMITNAAIHAVRSVSPESQIMIHRAGIADSSYFFDQLNIRNVDFDIAGLSYYPWWHGMNVSTAENELNSFARSVTQKIMIVETAYPFTLSWNDNLNNIIGLNNQVSTGFPATPAGQRNFMMRIHNMVKNLPNEQGLGYCYWAPDWVAHDRSNETFMNGSSWENLALFDFEHKVTEAMEVFLLN
jgi:arabinogalactan endo-1,4-beta-galactosidase